jgi:hypothetical protein
LFFFCFRFCCFVVLASIMALMLLPDLWQKLSTVVNGWQEPALGATNWWSQSSYFGRCSMPAPYMLLMNCYWRSLVEGELLMKVTNTHTNFPLFSEAKLLDY